MPTLTEHLIKLSDHRDRDRLELTLCKALLDLLPAQRVVIAKVMHQDDTDRWIEVASLDARGGGKVLDPLRVEFAALALLDDAKDRVRCLRSGQLVEVAWAGEDGPRITYLPLFDALRNAEEGVLEIHSGRALDAEQLEIIAQLRQLFGNMYNLLAYSNRDGLTGLLNQKALNDTFYNAVLEEMDEGSVPLRSPLVPAKGQERRYRVPPNYWLGTATVDGFAALREKIGTLASEEVLLMMARILNNTFRTHDRIYRLGGDCFAVLMHCPEESLVLAAFERFRANMDKFVFPQVGHATASAGFTRVSPLDTPTSALARAEQAAAFGRQQGGNRVYGDAGLERQQPTR